MYWNWFGFYSYQQKLISHLRINSHAHCYATSMSPPVAQQIISSMRIIMGEDGTDEGYSFSSILNQEYSNFCLNYNDRQWWLVFTGQRRLVQLARNSRYFRQKLRQLGLIVYGNDDSPVVPVLLFMPAKIAYVLSIITLHFVIQCLTNVLISLPPFFPQKKKNLHHSTLENPQCHIPRAYQAWGRVRQCRFPSHSNHRKPFTILYICLAY